MKNDIITDIKIEGDFFGTKDILELEAAIKNQSATNLKNLLCDIQISNFIFGMTNEEFINLIKI